MTVAVITGGNSGIGRATAVRLGREGMTVYATMRDPAKGEKLRTLADEAGADVRIIALDVTSDDSVNDAFQHVMSEAGSVDVLVNSAGIAANGTVEETPLTDYRQVFEVNVCGPLRCMQAVLPGMREGRTGVIVNVTSVVGRVAMVAQAPYVASKWALEGLSEELAHELASFGIRVAMIEPGVTKTAMFAKNTETPVASSAYDAQYRRMFQFYAKGIPQAAPASDVAEVIHHAITTPQPKLRYVCSFGGPEIVSGRAAMTDEEWVALGSHADDATYYARFQERFGLDVAPEPAGTT
jgi:NAD(P)-dependent dehydrogenase (short-subunit alcohol dehydrogenase family)